MLFRSKLFQSTVLHTTVDDTFLESYGSASHLFQLEKECRILRLTQELDREEIASHEIRIIATNNANGPTTPLAPDSRSQLIVRIKVNDVNDNPPKFRQSSYSAGITVNDYPGKILFEVIADDPDEDDVISYSIDETSLQTHGENLPTSPFPFAISREAGQLSLGVQIQDRMKGHFNFRIVATDLGKVHGLMNVLVPMANYHLDIIIQSVTPIRCRPRSTS